MNFKDMTFPTPRALDKFTADLGVSAGCVWKWRQDGVLETCNLHGRQFVTPTQAARFIERLERGEFARTKKVPRPPRARRRAQEGAEA